MLLVRWSFSFGIAWFLGAIPIPSMYGIKILHLVVFNGKIWQLWVNTLYHGNPQPPFLCHILGPKSSKTFIFHGFWGPKVHGCYGYGVDPRYILLTHRQRLQNKWFRHDFSIQVYPIGSMYGIFTYIWLIFMVNVATYTIHGSYGYGICEISPGDVRNLSQGNKSCTGEARKKFARRRPSPPLGRFTCRR